MAGGRALEVTNGRYLRKELEQTIETVLTQGTVVHAGEAAAWFARTTLRLSQANAGGNKGVRRHFL